MQSNIWWNNLPAQRQQKLYERYFPGKVKMNMLISQANIDTIYADETELAWDLGREVSPEELAANRNHNYAYLF